jgi:hypothetical protein
MISRAPYVNIEKLIEPERRLRAWGMAGMDRSARFCNVNEIGYIIIRPFKRPASHDERFREERKDFFLLTYDLEAMHEKPWGTLPRGRKGEGLWQR